jgi:hypothetical protein
MHDATAAASRRMSHGDWKVMAGGVVDSQDLEVPARSCAACFSAGSERTLAVLAPIAEGRREELAWWDLREPGVEILLQRHWRWRWVVL